MAGDSTGNPVVVSLAIDRGYAPWAATVIRSSVRANPRSEICFEVLHDSTLSDEDCGRLERTADSPHSTVRFHPVAQEKLAAWPTTAHFGAIVWLRFFLPDVLHDRSRTIYLDSDTLVMSELKDLWATPLGPHPLGAVANVVEPTARPHVEALGIGYPGDFFNSGVLLMDLDRMRAERSADHLFQTAGDLRGQLVWPDQDVLNVAFARRWLSLHPRWNVQNSFWAWSEWAAEVYGPLHLEQARTQPAIRHFEGPGLAKPWHYLCPYPGSDRYRLALAETPWAGVALEDRTASTWLIRRLPVGMRPRAYARLSRTRARVSDIRLRIGGDTDRPDGDGPGASHRSRLD